MNVLIIEDETAAFKNLRNILSEIDPSITVTGNTESVSQTITWLKSNPKPDLIFMDIHLSDGSAFNIFNILTVETPVIFTTAYDEYAIDAFKVNSIDYLLKPIEPEDVKRALNKFRKLTQHEIVQYLSQLTKMAPQTNTPDTILVPVNDRLVIVKVNEISYFYTDDGKTRVVLKDRKMYHYHKSLEVIYQTLNHNLFFRANKQFIVAKDAITNITIWFDNRLHLTLGTSTPERIFISKNKAATFKKWMGE